MQIIGLERFPLSRESISRFSICYIDPINLKSTIRILIFFGLAASPVLAQQDPRAGSWTLVSAQASLDPANKLSITPVQDQLHVVMSGDRHLDFTAKANGHPAPAPGNLGFNQIQLHRADRHTSEVKEMKDGVLVATVLVKPSPDGKELATTRVMAGRPDQVTVWTRTGGAKVAHDPLAGEWTEDPTKSIMRQGMTLKIEPNGNGGVRFSGDYSYDARFDGKAYDLRNSGNDSIKLQLVDPHTVSTVSMRGDQVTEKDKWTVSPDGQQLTVATTGVLETGQHLTQTLTFKKQ